MPLPRCTIGLWSCLLTIIGSRAAALPRSQPSPPAAGTDAGDGLVTVRFYGEAQCPFCRKFVTEAWQPIWADPQFHALVDYDFVPWGNAYFPTKDCGDGPEYSADERQCWYRKCLKDNSGDIANGGDDVLAEDQDCFSGSPIYQHSTKEGRVDIYETCVKEVLGLEAAVAFTYCCEGPNMDDATMDTAEKLMQKCLSSSALGTFADDDARSSVQQCADERGRQIEVANAKKTPYHEGVPYVMVNGQALDDPFKVKDAICSHITTKNGQRPSACNGVKEQIQMMA